MMPDNINVLFLAGGRRITLAEQFEARGFKVFGYEKDIECPLSKDHLIFQSVFNWNNIQCYNEIKEIIKNYNIKLVIPLSDESAKFAADYGLSISSSCHGSWKCYNKKELERHTKYNVNTYCCYPFPTKYPLIYKPIHGYGSKGLVKEESWWTDKSKKRLKDTHIAQRFISGTEFSVDCYFDKNSRTIGSSVRTRDRVGDGEVIDSTIVLDRELSRIAENIGESLLLRGPICIQFIRSHEEQKYYLIEVNARFGGGSTLSIQAGLDMIEMIKKEYIEGKELCPCDWKVKIGTKMKRVYMDYYYE